VAYRSPAFPGRFHPQSSSTHRHTVHCFRPHTSTRTAGMVLTVPRRAPLEPWVGWVAGGTEGVPLDLGCLVLHHLDVLVLRELRVAAAQHVQSVGRGREGVHQREAHMVPVLLAQAQHLARDQVEEARAIAHRQQRLGALEAHRGPQPAVELEDNRALQQFCARLRAQRTGGAELLEGGHRISAQSLDLCLWEQPEVARDVGVVGVLERLHEGGAQALGLHLALYLRPPRRLARRRHRRQTAGECEPPCNEATPAT
jgi:hypothetical protein